MVGIINSSVTTDVPFTDLWALANLARQVPSGQIKSRFVDDSMIIDVNGDGTVLLPDRDKIKKVVQELFYDPAVKKEAARVEVLNGTTRSGLAQSTQAALQERGYSIVRYDSAERTDYKETVIVDRGGKAKGTVQKLAQLMGVASKNVRSESAGGGADVTIILGADFKAGF
jgi:hypothetical protein